MLVGRANELGRIAQLLDGARERRSAAIVLRGEAGVGKSALLDWAAAADGFRVLRAQGIESEAEIAFSGLHDLLRPIIDLRARLPRPQATALEAALSLAEDPAPGRLAIDSAVLGLLAAASEDRPVLAIVDDVHLVDRASADTVGFAARRLHDERVAMLFAVRDDDASTGSLAGLDELPIHPLPDTDAAQVLDGSGRELTGAARRHVLALARGNPLALLELPAYLADEAGSPELSLPPRSLLSRTFGRRVDGLPDATRRALVVAAANDDGDLATILRACRRAGIGPDALAPAEDAGVIFVGADALSFRHPLVRAVVYADASAGAKREAHRVLAEALLDHRAEARWAWHRALAAVGPDEAVAAALEAVAGSSGSASASAEALERAARLSVDPASRTRRLVEAAKAAEIAGHMRSAGALAAEAGREVVDQVQRSELDHLLGRIWALDGDVERSVAVLTAGARRIARDDPDRAARMLAEAADTAIDDLPRATSLAAEAVALPVSDRASEQFVLLRFADVMGWKGDAQAAAEAWTRSAALVERDDAWSVRLAAEALFSAGSDDASIAMATRAVELARDRGQLTTLVPSLDFIALAHARSGRLLDALDASVEALDLVAALGQAREEMVMCGTAAWIEALLGRDGACRTYLARAAEISARTGHPNRRRPALGVLELALGRPDVAASILLANVDDRERLGADAIAPCSFVPSLVEALVWSGRAAEASPIARSYASVAERSGRASAVGLALRCTGLADTSVDDLSGAVQAHEAIGNGYEAARTRLCLGEVLRRRGRRADARVNLRAALEAFETIGAHAWGERARLGLEATGLSVRRRRGSSSAELTPQERNVARLVAAGLTNREIAERLYVTNNTVETHLRHIFEKLEVTSRTQLAISFNEGRA